MQMILLVLEKVSLLVGRKIGMLGHAEGGPIRNPYTSIRQ